MKLEWSFALVLYNYEFYIKLKEIIFTQQAQSAWMPEEKVSIRVVKSESLYFMSIISVTDRS